MNIISSEKAKGMSSKRERETSTHGTMTGGLFYNTLINTLLTTKAAKVTKYVSPKDVIKASRKTYNGRLGGGSRIEIVLTIGRPNYLERKFIKQCLKAGERFPVEKIQLKFLK